MRQTIKAVVHAALASAFLATVPVACGGTGDPSTQSNPSPQSNGTASTSTEEATLTRTIVRRAADGTETVTTDQITHAQQLAEMQERAAIKAGERIPETLTNSCSGSDITLGDSAGHEICFYNGGSSPDYAYLPNYTEYCKGLTCYKWHGTSIYGWVSSGESSTVTASSTSACPYHCPVLCSCVNTVVLPANNGACDSQLFCQWTPPVQGISAGMDYLWMNTGTASLCNVICTQD